MLKVHIMFTKIKIYKMEHLKIVLELPQITTSWFTCAVLKRVLKQRRREG